MPLNDEAEKTLRDFLYNKIPDIGACPLCGQKNWAVSDSVWQLLEYPSGGGVKLGGGPILPLISITCTNCGNTHLLNAIVAGIVKSGQEGEKNG